MVAVVPVPAMLDLKALGSTGAARRWPSRGSRANDRLRGRRHQPGWPEARSTRSSTLALAWDTVFCGGRRARDQSRARCFRPPTAGRPRSPAGDRQSKLLTIGLPPRCSRRCLTNSTVPGARRPQPAMVHRLSQGPRVSQRARPAVLDVARSGAARASARGEWPRPVGRSAGSAPASSSAVLRNAEHWINERRTSSERRLDRLGAYLAQHPEAENPEGDT